MLPEMLKFRLHSFFADVRNQANILTFGLYCSLKEQKETPAFEVKLNFDLSS